MGKHLFLRAGRGWGDGFPVVGLGVVSLAKWKEVDSWEELWGPNAQIKRLDVLGPLKDQTLCFLITS